MNLKLEEQQVSLTPGNNLDVHTPIHGCAGPIKTDRLRGRCLLEDPEVAVTSGVFPKQVWYDVSIGTAEEEEQSKNTQDRGGTCHKTNRRHQMLLPEKSHLPNCNANSVVNGVYTLTVTPWSLIWVDYSVLGRMPLITSFHSLTPSCMLVCM